MMLPDRKKCRKSDIHTDRSGRGPELAASPQELGFYAGGAAQNVPLRLSTAAKIAFPDGSMTASGLRREASRGRLVIERIAGKDFTTLANIEEMRKLCRVQVKGHGSTCAAQDQKSDARRPGSSGMAPAITPQVALETRLLADLQKPLKKP
jgi:hypothetical protein